MVSLIGKRVRVKNINRKLYKWQSEGVVCWQGGQFVALAGHRGIVRISSVEIVDN